MSGATLLTLSRIGVVPLLLLGLLSDNLWIKVGTATLFALASITDFFDGWAARKYNQVSDWGKIFDPVADKVLVTSVLIALIPKGSIDPYLVILLLARDTLVGGLRNLAAINHLVIAAKTTGKWKTALQMVAIPALIIGEPFGPIQLHLIGFYALWISVVLSVISGVEYAWFYRKALPLKKDSSKTLDKNSF